MSRNAGSPLKARGDRRDCSARAPKGSSLQTPCLQLPNIHLTLPTLQTCRRVTGCNSNRKQYAKERIVFKPCMADPGNPSTLQAEAIRVALSSGQLQLQRDTLYLKTKKKEKVKVEGSMWHNAGVAHIFNHRAQESEGDGYL